MYTLLYFFLIQVEHLTGFNGRTVAEAGRNMLRETVANEVAMKYNLSGKGALEKKSFQGLHLYKIIFGKLG